jgi:NADH-quinone oxidoreductase subunit J
VITGAKTLSNPIEGKGTTNLETLAKSLFTDYVFAFELTSVLLVIAVVGAVVLARRPPKSSPSNQKGA